MIKIRKYQEKDKKSVKKLINSVLVEIFKKEGSLLEDLDNIQKNYSLFLVAEDNKKIVGTVALKNEGEGVGKLRRMYLQKEYRGRGIAQELFNNVLNYARKEKFSKIILTTYPKMKAAIKFYKKNGFKLIKKENSALRFEKII